MSNTAELYKNRIIAFMPEIKNDFGVHSMYLFGSVARGEDTDISDVDICVDMEPDMLKRINLSLFLQNIINRPVDVVRRRERMDSILKNEIEKDGIRIF